MLDGIKCLFDPVNKIDPNGEFAIAAIAAAGFFAAAATGYIAGQYLKDIYEKWDNNPYLESNYPPGYWPADKGAEEWGRRDGCGAKEGRDKFHDIKNEDKGSKADHDYGVNPETGDIIDPNGESSGNLND